MSENQRARILEEMVDDAGGRPGGPKPARNGNPLPPGSRDEADRTRLKVVITFPDLETEQRALSLLGRPASQNQAPGGEHVVGGGALEALAFENIPFAVRRRAP